MLKDDTTAILIYARTLLENPNNWTQGAWARDKDGYLITYAHDDAVAFCSLGAINKACAALKVDATVEAEAMKRLMKCAAKVDSTDSTNIILWNDKHCRKHSQVLKAFDCAINGSFLKRLGRKLNKLFSCTCH